MVPKSKKRAKKSASSIVNQNHSSLLETVLNYNAQMAQKAKQPQEPQTQRRRNPTARKFL